MMTHRQGFALAFAGAVLAAAYALRLLWVEDAALGFACAADMTLACSLRQGLILAFHSQGLGVAAAVLGGLALWRRTLPTATLALAASALALVLYNVDLGAFGTVAGLIALARAGGAPAGRSPAG